MAPQNSSYTRPLAQSNHGCLRLLLFTMGAIGFGFFYSLFLHPLWLSFGARGWEETPCKIVVSEIKEVYARKGPRFRAEVEYSYRVGEGENFCSRVDFFGDHAGAQASASEVVERFRLGSRQRCWVNPAQPTEAVLDREPDARLWRGLFALPLMALGGLAFAPRHWLPRPRNTPGLLTPTSRRPSGLPAEPAAEEGPVVLPAKSKQWRWFIAYCLFTVIWIVPVTAALFGALAHGEFGKLILFLPFCLIGLLLIGLCVYAFLALFNPPVRIVLNRRRLPLGSRLAVEWEVSGAVERLRSLRFSLQAKEETRRQSGKSTEHRSHVFAILPLAHPATRETMASGRAELVIPAGLMHTLEGVHNSVKWSLHVHGDIPRYPDLHEEHPITILPFPLPA